MSLDKSTNLQSMQELEWLAEFYIMHGREDLAEKICRDIERLRGRAKNSDRSNPSKTANNVKPDSSDLTGPG